MRGSQNRKLLRLKVNEEELRLEKLQIEFIEYSLKKMAGILGVDDIEELNRKTGHPYKTLKILLSVFRRVRTLADYQIRGKVDFPDDAPTIGELPNPIPAMSEVPNPRLPRRKLLRVRKKPDG